MKAKNIVESFNYAFQGIVHVLHKERNMKIHFILAISVLVASLFFKLSPLRVAAVFFAISLVFIAELINSAIEYAINTFTTSYDPLAKMAKDAAAGAVLVAAVNSVIVAYLVFVSRQTPTASTVIQRVRDFPAHITFIVILLTVFSVIALKALSHSGTMLRGGMPSGHAAVAFAVAVSLAFITGSLLVTGLAFFLALLVSQSRIQTGIHSFLEVAAGAILGALIATLFFQLFK